MAEGNKKGIEAYLDADVARFDTDPKTDDGIAKQENDAEARRLAQQQAMVNKLKEEDRYGDEVRKKKQQQAADDDGS